MCSGCFDPSPAQGILTFKSVTLYCDISKFRHKMVEMAINTQPIYY